jgi:peptide/nickel transport system substrate-binding protein
MPGLGETLSRRGFLAGASGVALGLALDACGGSSKTTSSVSTTAGGTPKPGGTLTVAATGGGSADSLNPLIAPTSVSLMGVYQIYEQLTHFALDGSVELQLAESMEPNKDGTQWTIRLLDGVTFHDGRPLRSEDVLHSFQQWYATANQVFVADVDVKGLKVLDARTLLVPMVRPMFELPNFIAVPNCFVVPSDFNYKHPGRANGTGPFKYVSFAPGRQTVVERNPNYRQPGKPYLDRVVINDFFDETAQVDALVSGAANAANSLSLASVDALKAGGVNLLAGNSDAIGPFVMNCSVKPFSDVRVRQAFRLIVNRDQMREVAFGPYGRIANDTWCAPGDPLYVALPQRNQDIEQAKSLLAQAGQSGLTVTLTTAPLGAGSVAMSQVFAQQAKAAGVNVVVNQVGTDVLYGPRFLNWPFTIDQWAASPYLGQVTQVMVPPYSYDETHFKDPRYNSLYLQALATGDLSMRREIAGELQRIEYDKGGYIVPVFQPDVDAHATSVHGLMAGGHGQAFNNYTFSGAWID